MPSVNYFFLSSLPVLLKITPIVCVSYILKSAESFCSHLTSTEKRLMIDLKEVLPILCSYAVSCSMKAHAPLLSQHLSKVKCYTMEGDTCSGWG